MVGWHQWLSGHEFEQTGGDSEGQGSLVCCSHGVTKSRTWLSNWTKYTRWPHMVKKNKPTIIWKSVSSLRGSGDILTFVWCFCVGHRDFSWSGVRVIYFCVCSTCGQQGVFIKCLLCGLACIRLPVESQSRETLSGTREHLWTAMAELLTTFSGVELTVTGTLLTVSVLFTASLL